MDPVHLVQLCEEFGLGETIAIREDNTGALNKNYFLTTSTGEYFIKSVRKKQQSRIPYIAAAEKFFASDVIPALCMQANASGEVSLEIGNSVYTVYPYKPNAVIHTYTQEHVRAMGILLGHIHLRGASEVPDLLLLNKLEIPKPDNIIRELTERRAHIMRKDSQDAADEQFLDYIALKLDKVAASPEAPQLANDTLTHGDYHDRNILFQGESIVGVCDWEKVILAPRSYEVARAIEIICFGTGSAMTRSEDEMQKMGSEFLTAYNSVYPIEKEELKCGLSLRLYKLIHSVWIERQHYDLQDLRSDKFIPQEMRLIETNGLLDRIE
ncbi:MAG TPA: phosphotransferase [Candidatus Paceibacterota bacterium]